MIGEFLTQETATNRYIIVALIAAIAASVSLYFSIGVIGAPTGAVVTAGSDSQMVQGAAGSDPATGGVITSLTLNATGQTNNWQGYWGYVGSYIVLADSGQRFMYSWNTTNQSSGSVIASRANSLNITALSNQSACTVEDSVIPDAINDKVSSTFTDGAHTSIVIGNVTISSNTCTTDLFVDNVSNTTWEENMLTDGNGKYVYQVFIHTGYNVFNGNEANFQMIVPEDEAGAAGTTTYYFWLELF
jgi:hypothetical protein